MRKIAGFIFLLLCYQSLAHAEVSLTASDGSGLELREFKAKVVLQGMFAFTEIEMLFHNPENRRREGRFQITLPSGAAISRFAMSRGNQLLEGEVVERKLAQRAYEDFLHQRQDPALLEVDQGNRFNARVFPIVAKENKRIIISYSQTLNDGTYLLPLKDLPKLNDFSLYLTHDDNFAKNKSSMTDISGMQAQVSQQQIIKINHQHYKPERDFIMPLTQTSTALAVRADNLVATRIVPFDSQTVERKFKPQNWIVLIDTSASQAPYLKQTLEKLKQLEQQLHPGSLRVYSFDQEFRKHAKLEDVNQVMPLGASNLEQALKKIQLQHHQASRLLIVSDVVATAGQIEAKKLRQLLASNQGLHRVDVLLPSSHHDDDIANNLRLAAKQAGVVSKLTLPIDTLREKLLKQTYTKVPVAVDKAAWFWPQTIDAIQSGDAITVFAELAPSEKIRIKVGDKPFQPQARKIESLLLKREWARARVERLSANMQAASDEDMRNAMFQQIIKVSVDERIITPYTALLVLESAADYQRYGITQQSMADILTVGIDGVSVLNRSAPPRLENAQQERTPIEKGEIENDEIMDQVMENKSTRASDAAARPMAKRRPSSASAARPRPQIREDRPASSVARARVPAPAPEPGLDAEVAASEPAPPARLRMMAPRPRPSTAPEPVNAPAEAEQTMTTTSKEQRISPWIGEYKTFRDYLDNKKFKSARKHVMAWRAEKAQDVMALIALGEYFEAKKDYTQASRAYGSLIDYFPARADIRRWAAGRLLRFQAGYALALDSLQKAVRQRPDHPSGHYLLAWAYWLEQHKDKAKQTLAKALKIPFPRFTAAHRILEENLKMMNGQLKQEQLRFVLSWETDANDVDFHVRDDKNHHAYYSHPQLSSGGRLYADITTGYGPENFTINNPKHYPYKLAAHYYSMGPMGYGMGVLNIVRYNAKSGKIRLEFRPFIVMTNQAYVDLGQVNR